MTARLWQSVVNPRASPETLAAMRIVIAAHALSCDLTLVTNNTRHFQRVGGLKLSNWA